MSYDHTSVRQEDIGALAVTYANKIIDLLTAQLGQVIQLRNPEVLPLFQGEYLPLGDNKELLLGALQAWGIWFQLLGIAEENTAMMYRRTMEKRHGLENVPGTFANVFEQARHAGISPNKLQALLDRAHICPTLTAHPTEAKG